MLCITFERKREAPRLTVIAAAESEPRPGDMRSLARYMESRLTGETGELPDLPLPAEFRQLFRDWAAGTVNFVEITQGPDEIR